MIYYITTLGSIRSNIDSIIENSEIIIRSTQLHRGVTEEDIQESRRTLVAAVQYISFLKKVLDLLDLAEKKGKASAAFENSVMPTCFIAFSATEDGRYRCYWSELDGFELIPKTEKIKISAFAQRKKHVRKYERQFERAVENGDTQEILQAEYAMEYYKAREKAVEEALETGNGKADLFLNNELVARFSATVNGETVEIVWESEVAKFFQ